MFQSIKFQLSALLLSLFQYENKESKKLLNYLLIIVIFCFGLAFWFKFLGYGKIPSDRLDWIQITFPRLTVIQQSLSDLVLPLHIEDATGINEVTDRFLVIPDLIFSPDILLLGFITIENFIQIHVLICYGLGFLGLMRIKNRFHLSFTAYFLLFMMFNFNGFILTHLAIGHITWGAYFLLPFVIVLLADFFSIKFNSWKWIKQFALLQFVIYLFGGYHFFVWILIFIFILMLASREKRTTLLIALFFSILINLYRILPSALLAGNIALDFHTSFASSWNLLNAFISPVSPQSAIVASNVLDFTIWETSYYFGFVGFIFIVLLGILFLQRSQNSKINVLLIPVGVMAIMSIGYFYKPVFDSGLPIFSGERVFTRFIILPVMYLITIAIIQYQNLLERNLSNPIRLFFFWVLNLVIANDLSQYLSLWSMDQINRIFPAEAYFYQFSIQNHADPIYIALIGAGIILSIISCLFLFFFPKKLLEKIN